MDNQLLIFPKAVRKWCHGTTGFALHLTYSIPEIAGQIGMADSEYFFFSLFFFFYLCYFFL